MENRIKETLTSDWYLLFGKLQCWQPAEITSIRWVIHKPYQQYFYVFITLLRFVYLRKFKCGVTASAYWQLICVHAEEKTPFFLPCMKTTPYICMIVKLRGTAVIVKRVRQETCHYIACTLLEVIDPSKIWLP